MLIKGELEDQAGNAVELGQKVALRNVDLFSSSLLANRDIHQTIKTAIRERSENIRRIIAATAYFIEEQKIKSVDEVMQRAGEALQAYDRQRLANLADAQKNLNLSYATLSAIVEIFKRANTAVIGEITELGQADNDAKRIEKTKLYLKNAIIMYELSSFVIDYLSSFGLAGIEDLKHIREEVLADVKKGQAADEKLERDLNGVSAGIRDVTLTEIAQRKIFRQKVVQKWNETMKRIDGQMGSTSNAKTFIKDLTAIRDNMRGRIDILNIAATTNLVQSSISSMDALATGLHGWELPPLDETAARELLGMGE
ncbi:hypothetical protein [Paraburkholderia sp. SG-MS1]|uniref:hypothetical protein n=1 Tax=Paraburkholderia sp. SG-MS1 TaxID=2023741 RepID=UPI001445B74A|nr:hypothetical protein [Paraburkholderia sp. SG-MS1]